MRQVYVINGSPGAGKTTFGELVAESMNDRDIPFQHISSIDPIKNILLSDTEHNPSIVSSDYYQKLLDLKKTLTSGADWDGATKDEYWRGVMAELKKQIVQTFPGLIEEYIATRVLQLPESSCVFVDILEAEGIRALREYFNTMPSDAKMQTLLIESDSALHFNNSSDTGVSHYNYDIRIRNDRNGIKSEDSLAQLRLEAVAFCNEQFPTRKGIESGD